MILAELLEDLSTLGRVTIESVHDQWLLKIITNNNILVLTDESLEALIGRAYNDYYLKSESDEEPFHD